MVYCSKHFARNISIPVTVTFHRRMVIRRHTYSSDKHNFHNYTMLYNMADPPLFDTHDSVRYLGPHGILARHYSDTIH